MYETLISIIVGVNLPWKPISAPLPKLKGNFDGPLSSLRNDAVCSSPLFKCGLSSKSFPKCACIKKECTDGPSEYFSVLGSDTPWDSETTWSTMALYLFSLHVPLSFGGLSVVAYILQQPVLDLQIEAVSLLAIQTLELGGVLWLLRFIAKPEYRLVSFFRANRLSKDRNWLMAAAIGLGFLILLVFITSFIANKLTGSKDVNSPILKDILSSGSISEAACILVYCIITPLLEEIVYRGFLLSSLTSRLKWHQAVFISSAIFSAAHFSAENFLQLFAVGSVLGCSYCWTGNLISSFLIHSLYNALTLVITFLS